MATTVEMRMGVVKALLAPDRVSSPSGLWSLREAGTLNYGEAHFLGGLSQALKNVPLGDTK